MPNGRISEHDQARDFLLSNGSAPLSRSPERAARTEEAILVRPIVSDGSVCLRVQ